MVGFNSVRFAEAVEWSGKTSSQIERDTGINQRTIAAYRQGKRNPTSHNLAVLCSYLQISSDWLLGLRRLP